MRNPRGTAARPTSCSKMLSTVDFGRDPSPRPGMVQKCPRPLPRRCERPRTGHATVCDSGRRTDCQSVPPLGLPGRPRGCLGDPGRRADRASGRCRPVRGLLAGNDLTGRFCLLLLWRAHETISPAIRLFLPFGRVPESHFAFAAVSAGCGEPFAIRAERHV